MQRENEKNELRDNYWCSKERWDKPTSMLSQPYDTTWDRVFEEI